MISLEHDDSIEIILATWRSRLEKHPITGDPIVTDEDLRCLIKQLLDLIDEVRRPSHDGQLSSLLNRFRRQTTRQNP